MFIKLAYSIFTMLLAFYDYYFQGSEVGQGAMSACPSVVRAI